MNTADDTPAATASEPLGEDNADSYVVSVDPATGDVTWRDPEPGEAFCPHCNLGIGTYVTTREAVAATRARAEGAAAERGIRFNVETACDGYEALTYDDVPTDVLDVDDYMRGAGDAARAIRSVLS